MKTENKKIHWLHKPMRKIDVRDSYGILIFISFMYAIGMSANIKGLMISCIGAFAFVTTLIVTYYWEKNWEQKDKTCLLSSMFGALVVGFIISFMTLVLW